MSIIVHEEAARAFTLPARLYTDPGVFERERERIFHRSWVALCHRTDLADVCGVFAGWVADQNVFVVRGKDGLLRGFFNVCQHRAHELVKAGASRATVITCPYHAWSYHADGRLRTARGCERSPDFEAAGFSLKPVQVEDVAGIIFVNLSTDAPALRAQAPELEPAMLSYFPDLPRFVRIGEISHRMGTNWKARIDNSLECYHCAPVHKSFARIVDLDSYRSVDRTIVSTHHGRIVSGPGPCSGDDRRTHYVYWHVFPLTEFNASTDYPMFTVFRNRPLAVDVTELTLTIYAPPTIEDAAKQEILSSWLDNDTNAEDVALCEAVQRGLGSLGYDRGRFIVNRGRTETSEHSVHHFHRLVADALRL